jgi:hypothetical protein
VTKHTKLGFTGIVLASCLFFGCQNTDDLLKPQDNSATLLHARYRSPDAFQENPIQLDGQAIDREWGGVTVPYHNVRVSGENGAGQVGAPQFVSMKAVYTDRDVFFLIRWSDLTVDDLKDAMLYVGPPIDDEGPGCQPVLESESSWIRNPGGVFDEDRMALAFEVDSVGNAVGTFSEIGCRSACHVGQTPAFGQPDYGRLDIWQWLAARTNPARDLFDPNDNPNNALYGISGYLDDLHADSGVGLIPDPGTPAFRPNFQEGGDVPLYIYRAIDDPFSNPADPARCFNRFGERCRRNNGVSASYVWREDIDAIFPPFGACDTVYQTPLPAGTEPHKWRPPDYLFLGSPGDLVSGWYLTYPSGSRADVHGTALWENGIWTLEIGRRLNTGDAIHDVRFAPSSGGSYAFTLAIMDNSSTDQLGSEPQILVFDAPESEQ